MYVLGMTKRGWGKGLLMVKLENVDRAYGSIYALKNINMDVAQGDFISIMGPSGSGKTTLLNIIGCLDKPTSGKVLIDDINVSNASQKELVEIRRNKIGLIFQQYHLVPYLTAVENVMLAQHYHSIPDIDQAKESLINVGLEERLNHYPSELSGGEQQRVCIARALINRPNLILADEPTGNLDIENENIVIELLQKMSKEGHTLILVTHNPAIGNLAHKKIQLNHGEIL